MEENKTKNTPDVKNKTEKESYLKETFLFALIALAIVIPIRIFVAQPFIVSGSSMFPTFEDKQYLIVDELTYRLKEPKRGSVIIFKVPNDTKKYFIKRIIGLPGETVKINGDSVSIINKKHPEGIVLNEQYINSAIQLSLATSTTLLNNDQYFVMGDNRNQSYDSRYWGPLESKYIIGRPIIRLFPFQNFSIFPGEYSENI